MAVWISGMLILPVLFFAEFGGLRIDAPDRESETRSVHCDYFKPIIDQCSRKIKVFDKEKNKADSETRNGQQYVQCEDLKDLKVITELCSGHLKMQDRKKKPGKSSKPGKKKPSTKPGKNSSQPGKKPPKQGKRPSKPGKQPSKKGNKGKKPNKPTQRPDMTTTSLTTNTEITSIMTTATTTISEEGCSSGPENYYLSEGDGITISSPGYLQKQNYSNNLHCEWILTAPPGEKVSFTMLNINTEYGYDIVAIFDGISGDKGKARFITTMSGDEAQEAVISSKEQMRVTFTSDINVNKIGFQANVIAFKKADLPEFTWIDPFNIYIRFSNGKNESIQLVLASEDENACLFEGKTSETSIIITSPLSSDGCQSLDLYLEIMVKSTHLKKKKAIYTLKNGKLQQIDQTTFENNEVSRKRNVSKIEVPQKLRMPIQFGYDLGLKNKFMKYGQGAAYIRKRIQEMFYASKWGLKEIFNQTKFELILEKKIIFINEELKMNNSALLKSRKYQLREDIPIIILCAEDYENNIKGLSFRSGACRKDKERYGVAMVVWRDDGGLAGDVLEHEMGHLIGGVHNEKHATETDVGHSDFNSDNVNFWFNLAGSRCYGKYCSHPPSKPHGTWICDTENQSCDLKCDAGFASMFSNIQCENGDWSDSINDIGCSPSVFLLAGGWQSGDDKNVELYDSSTGSVSCSNHPPPLDQEWRFHTSFTHHGTVYMCGGGHFTESMCISINSQLNTWKKHTLVVPRKDGLSSVVMDNTLFLIGGQDSNSEYHEAVSTPLPLTEKPVLTAVPNLSYRGDWQCTAKIDRDSFVVTGGLKSSKLSEVTRYNIVDETTETLAPLQQARLIHGCVMVEVNMKKWMVVSGGYVYPQTLKTTEILDTSDTANVWNYIGNLNVGRDGHGMAVTERGVIAIGGKGSSYLNSVEVLDWASGQWQLIEPSLIKSRARYGGVVEIPADIFGCKSQPITIADCSSLPSKQNGKWSCEANNGKCSLICDPGFVSLYSSTTCSSGGTWKEMNKMECSPSVFVLAGGWGTDRNVELYDSTTGSISCSSLPPSLDQDWSFHTSFAHYGTVYMCGGRDTSNICISLDSQLNTWRTHTLLSPREQHSSVVMDNTLFLIGGFRIGGGPDRDGYLESFSTPLPLTDKPVLTVVPNLSNKGQNLCTAKINQNSFVIAGGYYKGLLSDVTIYNILEETTETLAPLQQAQRNPGCVVLEVDTKLWLIVTGAYKTTEILDITESGNVWKYIGNLNVARAALGMAVTERGVIAMGGTSYDSGMKYVELLDWESGQWQLIEQSLTTSRRYYGGVVEIPAEVFGCETHPITIAECDREYQYNQEYVGGEIMVVMDVPENQTFFQAYKNQTCHSLCENEDHCVAWTWTAQNECRINRIITNTTTASVITTTTAAIITTTTDVTTSATAVTATTTAAVLVPEYIKVSSNGGAATIHGSLMGIYKLQDQYKNNFPVWKKDGEEIYLCVNGNKFWGIRPSPDDTSSWIYNNKRNPTSVSPLTLTDGWRYSDSGWKTDNTIRIEAVTVSVPEYVKVSSNGGAATTHSSKMGIYKFQDEYHNNFPVWKKDGEEIYLFVANDQLWAIGLTLDTILTWIYNNKRNPTPMSPLTLTDGWRYLDGGYKTDDTIRIEAVTGEFKKTDGRQNVRKEGCVTVGGGEIGVSCVFPFIFKGMEYNECTTVDGDPSPWCSTLVNDDGVHVSGAGKWGYCGPKCNNQTETNTTTPATTASQTEVQAISKVGSISGLKNACKPKCYLVLGAQDEASTNTQYCNEDIVTEIGCLDIIHMEPDDFQEDDTILVCHEHQDQTTQSNICEPVSYAMVGVICNKQPSISTNSIYSRLNKYSYTRNNYGWGWGR